MVDTVEQPGELYTLGGPGSAELRERGSRFIALARRLRSEAEVETYVSECASAHTGARHVCYAYRLRDGTCRAHDANEPAQSAGAPMLQAIDGRGLTDVLVAVVRYYGGTKLGIGGLVRAYAAAAAAALEAAPLARGVPAARIIARYAYEHTGAVIRTLERHALSLEHGYAEDGVRGASSAVLPENRVRSVASALREVTGGSVGLDRQHSLVWYVPSDRSSVHRPG